jgi:hypothetical protein
MAFSDVVTRVLRSPSGKLLVGQLVDAKIIEDVKKLRASGYLTPIERGIEPARSVDGRWFAARSYLVKYGLQQKRPVPRPQLRYSDKPADEEGFPRPAGRGAYELSDGSVFKGKKRDAVEAEAALASPPIDDEEKESDDG